jgi:hypothetical protein
MSNYLETLLERRANIISEITEMEADVRLLEMDLEELDEEIKFVQDDMSGRSGDE